MNPPAPLPTILIVEDEAAIADLVAINLRHHGMQPRIAPDAGAVCRALQEPRLPDAIVLDWMLPGPISGMQLARQWRAQARTRAIPILMLTARAAELDKVEALEGGADDYITKPFSPRELLARIRSALRRSLEAADDAPLRVGDLTLDAAAHRVHWRGQECRLNPAQFRLLRHLMQHPGRVHSRARLLERVWERADIDERSVDVHVKRLRQALGTEAAALLETVRGAGYRLHDPGATGGHE